ncbi:GGDEF domain-containing protein [Paludisphaera mucosa]|uniref:diguanylate cyclase n=1 Tax=Paludisphaera mucosa TaxID=3030827 RepID=A0ABT6FCZ5_9BACT|nr:GGDEF domain-containing protein [Paludisphaera mucosa]
MPASATTLREGEGPAPDHRAATAAAAVGEVAVHDFAAAAAAAGDLDAIRHALAAASHWAAGHDPVALILAGEPDEADDGAGVDASIPVRVGERGRTWGRLVLRRRAVEPAVRPALVRRRLESLATLAAFAIERIAARHAAAGSSNLGDESDGGEPRDAAVHDATLLSAVLPFAMSQARRHKEPLSILCLAIDPLRGVRELLGAAAADRVVERVGVRIAGLLRSSDLVGRLDDDRLMAVLPRADLRDAIHVGEKLGRTIAADVDLLDIPLTVTLSVGAAALPSSAGTLGGLLDAADAALSEARKCGPGRIAAAPHAGVGRDRDVFARA